MRRFATLLIFAPLAAFAQSDAFPFGDAKLGRQVLEAKCSSCHVQRWGADGSGVFKRADRKASSTQSLLGRKELQALNALLITSEQKLGNREGLPRRDWFKHQIYAPGFYTGYGVKTMPQIREGLEENRFTEAQGGVRTVSAAVNALAAQVNEAVRALLQISR